MCLFFREFRLGLSVPSNGEGRAASVFLSKPFVRATAVLRWLGIVVPMAAVVGSLCALFLWSLSRVTELRFEHPWLLFGLPIAGLLVGLTYHWIGRSAEGGNNLIVDGFTNPGAACTSGWRPSSWCPPSSHTCSAAPLGGRGRPCNSEAPSQAASRLCWRQPRFACC